MDRKVLMVYYDLLDNKWSFYNDVMNGIKYPKSEAAIHGISFVPGLRNIGAIRINKSVWIVPEEEKGAVQFLIKHIILKYPHLNINYAEAIFKEEDIQNLWNRYKEYFVQRVFKFVNKVTKSISVDKYIEKIKEDLEAVVLAFMFDYKDLKDVLDKINELVTASISTENKVEVSQ